MRLVSTVTSTRLPGAGDLADLVEEVVDLHRDRADLDRRVDEAGRADHLLGEDAAGLVELPGRRGGRDEDRLRAHRVPLLELERAVVHAGGQAEAVLGEGELAAVVAAVHAADLRHADVALVGEDDGVVGDVLEEGRGRLARLPPGQVAGIVLDAVAGAGRLEHLEVEGGALLEPLGLERACPRRRAGRGAGASSAWIALIAWLSVGRGRHVVGVGVDPHLRAGRRCGRRSAGRTRRSIRAPRRRRRAARRGPRGGRARSRGSRRARGRCRGRSRRRCGGTAGSTRSAITWRCG